MNWLKENYGVMNLDDIMLDKEFLKDMILEIEKTRERNIVYNEDYKKEWLERWRVKNERKLVLRKVFGKEKEGI